jgi:hypothetical protein
MEAHRFHNRWSALRPDFCYTQLRFAMMQVTLLSLQATLLLLLQSLQRCGRFGFSYLVG